MDKPMRFLLFVMITLFITSCNRRVKLNISNNCDTTIDSLIVTNGFDKFKIKLLPANTTTEGFLNFSDVPNIDGGYSLILFKSGVKKAHGFGYYTNGSPISHSIDILIEKDTVICKEVFH